MDVLLTMNGTRLPVQTLVELTNAFQTVHTVYTGRNLTITALHLVNATGGAITVQVCFVPDGGTAVQANAILWDYSIAAHSFIIDLPAPGMILPSKASIQAKASAGASVNLMFSGMEE